VNNADVAATLSEVAALLDLKNESGFKVRAYYNAARAVDGLAEEIRDVAARGSLKNIKGVGSSTAERIDELLQTGSMKYLESLRSEFPSGVRDLLGVPGVGPSLARRVYQELGVESVEQLREASEDGRLAALSGLGEKTAQNVLRNLSRANKRESRISLGKALPVVEELMQALENKAPLRQLTTAGSLRRWAPTIGDIDLMATSVDPDRVMEVFVSLPQVSQVLAHGSTKSAILTDNGLQVDLRIVPDESFGALLQHFTGSKDHNIELREYSLHRGLSLNEYGIAEVETGQRRTFDDEHAFYEALEMAYIEPELRQGAGEIAAARARSLPDLVTTRDIRGDLHAHSEWSDGSVPIESMVEAARARGYEYMAITDHSGGIGLAGGLNPERLLEQIGYIRRLDASLEGFRLLSGSEVDIKRDGSLDFPDELLAQLDWVIASVHSGFTQTREQMTDRIIRAIENPHVDAIAHPTGRLIGRREPYEVDLERVFETAARTGTALEINSFPDRLDLVDTHARRARELGVMLVVNTDAHSPLHLDNIIYGIAMARRAWVEPEGVLNTLPFSELRAQISCVER